MLMNPSRIRNPSPSNDQSYRNALSKSPGLVILYQSIGPVHLPSLCCWVLIPRQLPVSHKLVGHNSSNTSFPALTHYFPCPPAVFSTCLFHYSAPPMIPFM